MLEASKTLRREQAREFGDLTEAGRKVDLALCYDGIELSNIEFKREKIASKDVTMQCRKNIRLGRCLQEAHRTIGLSNPSVVMADIAGMWNKAKSRDKEYHDGMIVWVLISHFSVLSPSL